MSTDPVSPRWTHWRETVDLEEYHARFARMEAGGQASHGEADFIEGYRPSRVLDAGCGMGRVAIELHQRGIAVVGCDLDDDLLSYARTDMPEIQWRHEDLATMRLDGTFDVVAMPGNVMIFCRAEDRGPIVSNLARHLCVNGLLIAGFSIDSGVDALTLEAYDEYCVDAGLALVERYDTWERARYTGGSYAVSVHRFRRLLV